MSQVHIQIQVANCIKPESWLMEPKHKMEWFVDGHAYAATQTRAIPALSQVSPEALYFAVWAIMHGAEMAGHLKVTMTDGSSFD